jgi:hypothetical protein
MNFFHVRNSNRRSGIIKEAALPHRPEVRCLRAEEG